MSLHRRLSALEGRRRGRDVPRFVVLWGEGDPARNGTPEDQLIRIAWVKPSGEAIYVLPHNGRDALPGASR